MSSRWNIQWALCLALLCAARVEGSEFESGLDRLHRRQGELDQRLNGLGIGFTGAGPGRRSPSETKDSNRPLFKMHTDLSRATITAGKLLFGEIYTRLIVGPEGSPVLIELIGSQGSLSGLRLMGVARQASGQDRLLIEFKTLLLKSGQSVPIAATALDSEGALGLTAQVFSRKALVVTGSLASSFVSGLAAAGQTQTTNAFGFSQTQPTGRNAILQGVAQTAADQSKRLIEGATAEKPIHVVEAGRSVIVLVQEEVRL